jgi:selenocysteine lyase/cysteine desulfurase
MATTDTSHAISPLENYAGLAPGTHYLYTGAQAPALRRVGEIMSEVHRHQSGGPQGRLATYEAEEHARGRIAELAGVAQPDVSFIGDTSTAWNVIAGGLEFAPGDNIVLNDMEHPAVVVPWLRLSEHGLKPRFAHRDDRWQIEPDAIRDLCDGRTRAIAVSHVSYVNGYVHDLAALASIAAEFNAALFVDYSHGLGVVPPQAQLCDIGVSASYKWTLGPYGTGIVLWNRERYGQFRPGAAGWRSLSNLYTEDRFERIHLRDDARRFQLGAPGFAAIAGLGAAVTHLAELGAEKVHRHAVALSGRCVAELTELGLHVITPTEDARRAGNVSFLHPQAEQVADRLVERGIYVWGGDGRIRASYHVMNGDDDVAALTAALREILVDLPVTSSAR